MCGAVDETVIEPDPNEEAMRAVKQSETMRKTAINTSINFRISKWEGRRDRHGMALYIDIGRDREAQAKVSTNVKIPVETQ